MNALRKAGALFLGLLIALLFAELAVRTTGLAAKALQAHRNSKALSTRGSIRILCIGDSMTFGEYPPVLEELLNKSGKGVSFKVIDGGRPGANSTDSFSWLETNIDTYSPDLVLAMTGDHDKDPSRILQSPKDLQGGRAWLKKLRAYRLWHYTRVLLLKNGTASRFQRTDPSAQTPLYPPVDRAAAAQATAAATQAKVSAALAKLPEAQRQELQRLSQLIQEKDPGAQTALLDYLRRYPRHAEAHTWLGHIYARTGRRAEAEAQFERALKLEPQEYHALCGLAELWLEDNEKLSKAAALLERATALSPYDYQPFYQLGHACALQGKPECAIENLKRSAALRPDFSPAQLELASLYKEAGRYDDAARTLETLLQTEAGDSMAYAQLCSLYATYAPQKNTFLRTAEQALKNIRTRNTIGLRVCAEQASRLFHTLPVAARLYEKALKLAPDDTDTLISAAAFYKREHNDLKTSRALSEKALRLNPDARNAAGLAFLLDEKEHAAVAEDARYAAVTVANYRKIRQLLSARGITLVAMQYPTRRLQPLKDILGEGAGVYFVGNENMKALAEQNGYGRYFVDMYAGDFGHCTREGNELLAENAARVILEEVLKR